MSTRSNTSAFVTRSLLVRLVCTAAACALPLTAHAAFINHVGSTDPTTESPAWTLFNSAGSEGPGSESTSSGTYDYRFTNDAGTGGGQTTYFETTDTGTILTSSNVTNPWRLTAIVRLDSTSGVDQHIRLTDGTDRWDLWFLSDRIQYADDSSGFTDIASLDTTADYHRYDLIYTPVTAGVKSAGDTLAYHLDFDPTPLLTITRSDALDQAQTLIRFGAASSAGTGQANWNFVEFAAGGLPTVPEPSSALLLGLFLLPALAAARRTRRVSRSRGW